MPLSRVVRLIGPPLAAGALLWWHGSNYLPWVQPGPYLRESAVVWAYVLAGSIAWWRRPRNGTGPLMIALGMAWAVPYLPAPTALAPVWYSVTVAFAALPIAILIHLVLTFPEGRVGSPADRWTVSAAYVFGVVVPLASVVTCGPASVAPRCNFAPNALTILPAETMSAFLGQLASAGAAATLLAVLFLVVRRWSAASRPARRALTPVWLSSVVLAVSALDVAGRTWRAVDLTDWGLRYVRVLGSGELLTLRAVGHVLVPMAFLYGLLRLRRSRLAATLLARRLQGRIGHDELRDAVADAVGDPSVQVAYWLPGDQRYVDADGAPVPLPSPRDPRRASRLDRNGEHLAVLIHDRMLDDDLVEDVSAVAGLALENERLAAEVRSQLVALREAQGRIVAASDAARQRLERDLHDGAQQRLVTLSLALREAQQRIGGGDPAVEETLASLTQELQLALAELREFARGVHPTILTSDGLGAALRDRTRAAGVPVSLHIATERRYPQPVETTAYFVVLEALTNAVKHAAASSVDITVREDEAWLEVRIEDDGLAGARRSPGGGLQGIADRVGALGGTFELESPVAGGTTVIARLPLPASSRTISTSPRSIS